MVDPWNFLSDVPPEKSFWFCNGTVVRNIYELVNEIEFMKIWDFVYHVNQDNRKNDFAKWVRDVLGDHALALKLEKILDRKKYSEVIRKRIKEFE
ncbi:MAG: DUF5752 family protein [Nanoarchaeota archaeon]|nr:hypothetical protein [Nanoarchaeota archaeon]MBU1030362.1 hypothetical protein [Nanoarchaeota archaeon]